MYCLLGFFVYLCAEVLYFLLWIILGNKKINVAYYFDTLLVEIEMMKEMFAKLLFREDMSGCGNWVSTTLPISNAITNLGGGHL